MPWLIVYCFQCLVILFVPFIPEFYPTHRISYSSISVIGIVGNIAVFLVVTRTPQMRTLTNKFIGNLAIADLFVNILCVPFTLVSNLYPGKFKTTKFPYFFYFLSCEVGAYVCTTFEESSAQFRAMLCYFYFFCRRFIFILGILNGLFCFTTMGVVISFERDMWWRKKSLFDEFEIE